jgi:hypothetical protein
MISPFGNVTVLPDARWNPEPNHRGTFSILSSCLITMALCIWTAVHLNLPEHKKESQQKYQKTFWLALGLFAPEVVVWNAWRQRVSMNWVTREMRANGFMGEEKTVLSMIRDRCEGVLAKIQELLLLRAKDWPELANFRVRRELLRDNRIHPWTEVHSWYAVMGGFAFADTAAEEHQFMPGDRRRMALNDESVVWLARHRAALLPDISRQHIEDKSKSGGLGKFLTCWQASYFCIQCAFRLSQRSSISLLELNVFAHALCALILFWIWWDKPQDVQEPTLITGQDGLDVCAYFSLISDYCRPLGNFSQWVPCEPSSEAWEVLGPTTIALHRETHNYLRYRFSFGPFRQPCLKVNDSYWKAESPKSNSRSEEICRLDSRRIRLFTRAYRFAEENEDPFGDGSFQYVVDRCEDLNLAFSQLRMEAEALEFRDLLTQHPLVRTVTGLTLAGGCYGGLHLTAWTCRFPSHAETVLWRAASITILTTGPSIIAWALYKCFVIFIDQNWVRSDGRERSHRIRRAGTKLRSGEKVARRTVIMLWALFYILCRAFIVVECFIMLAHLPDTALEIPRWAAYIPHIT